MFQKSSNDTPAINAHLREEQFAHSSNLTTIRLVWAAINIVIASHSKLKTSFWDQQGKQRGPTAPTTPPTREPNL